MEQLPTEESFSAEEPIVRIIGTETEYDARYANGEMNSSWMYYMTPEMLQAHFEMESYRQGNAARLYLANGDVIYHDVGHLELASREGFGPREATAITRSGMRLLGQTPMLTQNGGQVFRRGATVDPDSGNITTKGFHLNFAIPDYIAFERYISLLESHLVTQLYTWGGVVTKKHFMIGPKSVDIGQGIMTSTGSATSAGNKPLGTIRRAGSGIDSDLSAAEHGLGRFEDRSKTPSSPWSDFMGMATTSVLLRVLEHPELFAKEHKALKALQLRKPQAAFKQVSSDLTMQGTHELSSGKYLSALDIQEKLAKIAITACEKLVLPEDEVFAVQEWVRILVDLRKMQHGTADVDLIADRVGWAGKYKRIAQRLGEAALYEGNLTALRYCLNWDRVAPTGAGQLYDATYGVPIFSKEAVEHFIYNPSEHTRSKVRSEYINNRDLYDPIRAMSWLKIVFGAPDATPHNLIIHPYQTKV